MRALKRLLPALAPAVFLMLPACGPAEKTTDNQAEQTDATVRIAFIDPLSGPFAITGKQNLAQHEFAVETLINEKGGVLGGRDIEIVPFDNKLSASETLIQLQVAIDKGIRIVSQGNSSGVAAALSQAIEKHNRRNPDDQVIYLNYSAVDPALTNEACSFWHFRFDANSDIKMDALTDIIAEDSSVKSVYVIGQDYSFGKAVASAAISGLQEKRPDIKIAGNELHPIGKVQDFTPYARKIIAADADAVITGNWGADMVGLGRAIISAGYEKPIYTIYGYGDGITKTFGDTGLGIVKIVAGGAYNPLPSERAETYVSAFKAQYPDNDITAPRITNAIEMVAKAIDKAGSASDMRAVATALEGMEHNAIWGGTVKMRAGDHQIIQDIHVFSHSNENISLDLDQSGFGLVREGSVAMASENDPHKCEMKRPR